MIRLYFIACLFTAAIVASYSKPAASESTSEDEVCLRGVVYYKYNGWLAKKGYLAPALKKDGKPYTCKK